MSWVRFIAFRLIKEGDNSFSKNMMRLAISAVSLSVATMIVTIATVKGFQNGIKDKIVKVHGNYIIDHAANMEGADPLVVGAQFVPEFVKNANASELKVMGIERAAISASKAGIIKGDVDIDGVVAKGMSYDDFHYCMINYLVSFESSHVLFSQFLFMQFLSCLFMDFAVT